MKKNSQILKIEKNQAIFQKRNFQDKNFKIKKVSPIFKFDSQALLFIKYY